jgi:hypothetical protein
MAPSLPPDLSEVDVDLLPGTDCRMCGLPHDPEVHAVLTELRAFLRADLARRLERPVLPEPFKRRANQKVFVL